MTSNDDKEGSPITEDDGRGDELLKMGDSVV